LILALADGDLMEVAWQNLGRPLVNPLRITPGPEPLISPKQL